jgi:hypothetical protein
VREEAYIQGVYKKARKGKGPLGRPKSRQKIIFSLCLTKCYAMKAYGLSAVQPVASLFID